MSVTITSGPTPSGTDGWAFGLSNGKTVYVRGGDTYTRAIISQGMSKLQEALDVGFDGTGHDTVFFSLPDPPKALFTRLR